MEKKNNVLGKIKVERETFEKEGKSYYTNLDYTYMEVRL